MKTKGFLNCDIYELNNEALMQINGGSFAYDLGFFLRECVIYITNGGNGSGTVAVATDTALNYKPLH